MAFLRSALFLLGLILAVVPFSLVALLSVPLPLLRRYPLISGWARFAMWMSRHVLDIRYEVSGTENIPDRPVIILSKHQSAWETLAYSSIFPPHIYVMKRELLRIPFLGWGLAILGCIAIDRGNRNEAVGQLIEQGKDRLRKGFSILIFPEGTRIPVGKRGRYRRGGAILAVNTGADVLPVAHNAGLLWPRNSFIKKSGTINIVIGPLIPVAERSAETVMREAEGWIEGQMKFLTPVAIEKLPSAPPG